MKLLLLVAHGSRRTASNHEVATLAKAVSVNKSLSVEKVVVAFLEFAQPDVVTAINEGFSAGASEITVLPYFLSGGNHVVNDLPHEINKAMASWPDKRIKLLPHIGASKEMAELIAASC